MMLDGKRGRQIEFNGFSVVWSRQSQEREAGGGYADFWWQPTGNLMDLMLDVIGGCLIMILK